MSDVTIIYPVAPIFPEPQISTSVIPDIVYPDAGAQPLIGLDVRTFGAKCDAIRLEGSITGNLVTAFAGNKTVQITGAAFVAADVGKYITISGIGASAAVLASTIASVVSATVVTLATAALTNASGTAQVIVYGSDDSAAVNSALSAIATGGGGALLFPPGKCLLASAITVPAISDGQEGESGAGIMLRGAGRGASRIIAGAAGMTAVFMEPLTWHRAAYFEHITIDANGLADSAYWFQQGYGAGSFNSAFCNGRVQCLKVGGGAVQAQDAYFTSSTAFNDQTIFPVIYPLYNIYASGSDNHYTDMTIWNASDTNFYSQSGGGDQLSGVHAWSYPAANYGYRFFWFATAVNCEVDGAVLAGVKFDGWNNSWHGGLIQNVTVGGYAFLFNTGNLHNITIIGPNITGMFVNKFVNAPVGVGYNNTIIIAGLPPIRNIGTGNSIHANTVDGSTPVTMTIDSSGLPSATTLPPFSTYSIASVTGVIVAFGSVTGHVGTWNVSLVIRFTDASAAPVIVSQSVSAGAGNTLVPTTPPVFAPSAVGVLSYHLNVVGEDGNPVAWSFSPQYSV